MSWHDKCPGRFAQYIRHKPDRVAYSFPNRKVPFGVYCETVPNSDPTSNRHHPVDFAPENGIAGAVTIGADRDPSPVSESIAESTS
jgi:hypothetical protein